MEPLIWITLSVEGKSTTHVRCIRADPEEVLQLIDLFRNEKGTAFSTGSGDEPETTSAACTAPSEP